MSWEFPSETAHEHSTACIAVVPGERLITGHQPNRFLLKLNLGVSIARIPEDETDYILAITKNNTMPIYPPLMPRPVIFESSLARLAKMKHVQGYAQRDPDDMTSTVLLIEDALDNRHIARAVYKPCGVPTRGVNVSRLMAADVKEVPCRAELTKEDFLLLMLSPMGEQALEEYENIVAVDGSGGMTVYKHMQMIAFVVANAGRSTVVAVAYVLSEREDVNAAVLAVLKLWAPKWLGAVRPRVCSVQRRHAVAGEA